MKSCSISYNIQQRVLLEVLFSINIEHRIVKAYTLLGFFIYQTTCYYEEKNVTGIFARQIPFILSFFIPNASLCSRTSTDSDRESTG